MKAEEVLEEIFIDLGGWNIYLPIILTHSLETKLHSSGPLMLKMERISEGKKSFGRENPPET